MLMSLIKYEFKVTYKKLFVLYALILFFAVINRVMLKVYQSGDYSFIGRYLSESVLSGAVIFSFVAAYFILFIIIGILTVFIVVKRFYSSMFGDVGYLMNTIPVEPWKNIVSKLIVAAVWIFLGLGVSFASVILLMNEISIIEFIESIYEAIIYMFSEGRAPVVLTFIVYIIVGMLSNIMIIYCSLSIGQLFNNHRKTMAFIAFLAISIITSFLVSSAYSICVFEDNSAEVVSGLMSMEKTFIIGIITNCIVFAATFAGTNFILKNKLNLE